MTKKEYEQYKESVEDFFTRNHLANLSSGRITCERCKGELNRDGDYPTCPDEECPAHNERVIDEAFFSWRPCECCQRPLGGDRYDASGFNEETKEAEEFVVCSDCIYFSCYGQLDDSTMWGIEHEEPEGSGQTSLPPAHILQNRQNWE